MANDPKKPLVGELSVDATDLTFLVDLDRGARVGLRAAQPGFEDALREIRANHEHGAGVVPETIHSELMLVDERIAQIDSKLPAARKLTELLEETRATLEDRRQRLISAVAAVVDAHAKAFGDTTLLARYEKTRAYRSAGALKAVRSRRRNQDQALRAARTGEARADARAQAPADAPAAPGAAPATALLADR